MPVGHQRDNEVVQPVDLGTGELHPQPHLRKRGAHRVLCGVARTGPQRGYPGRQRRRGAPANPTRNWSRTVRRGTVGNGGVRARQIGGIRQLDPA